MLLSVTMPADAATVARLPTIWNLLGQAGILGSSFCVLPRGLGLIAEPAALTALEQAAQFDGDRDVPHSAAFAVEVIRAHHAHS